jgi:hypothetical protein
VWKIRGNPRNRRLNIPPRRGTRPTASDHWKLPVAPARSSKAAIYRITIYTDFPAFFASSREKSALIRVIRGQTFFPLQNSAVTDRGYNYEKPSRISPVNNDPSGVEIIRSF